MEVAKAIRTKRAVRQFRDEKLPEEEIRGILNAGRRAQSSKNTQPWHFIAIQDKPTLEALSKMGNFAGHLAGAALGVAILTPDPNQRFSVMFDAGQAAAYMQLAAWELGVGSCLASIYHPEEARKLLSFPEEWHVRIAISFGYPADDSPQAKRASKAGRKTLDEVVHWEHW